MKRLENQWTRRAWLRSGVAAAPLLALGGRSKADEPPKDRALIAITLDLEMSRNYPKPEQTHWDYEKGNLDEDTKRYAVEAARRVKARGGVLHFFAVGRVLEQEDVSWLTTIHKEGHPVGNHTYDHVNVKATAADQIQFRFKRAPWLIEGQSPAEVISRNIEVTTRALRQRVGIDPAGFRTPGGFNDGLKDRPDVRAMLKRQGFRWVSSLYPAHPVGPPGTRPTREVFEGVVRAQALAQPFRYPDGLIEVPMSPVSDVSSMRAARWPLEDFLEALRRGVSWAIENRAVFDFLGHPSCLNVADPEFRAIDLICDLVVRSRGKAEIVSLDRLAERAT